MSVAVTLTARDVVAMSAGHRCALAEEEYHRGVLQGLRQHCQNVMGLIVRDGLNERSLNRAILAGTSIATRATAILPDEQARLFLPLLAIPRGLDQYETWTDLHQFFDRAWNATARFDGDDEEGVRG